MFLYRRVHSMIQKNKFRMQPARRTSRYYYWKHMRKVLPHMWFSYRLKHTWYSYTTNLHNFKEVRTGINVPSAQNLDELCSLLETLFSDTKTSNLKIRVDSFVLGVVCILLRDGVIGNVEITSIIDHNCCELCIGYFTRRDIFGKFVVYADQYKFVRGVSLRDLKRLSSQGIFGVVTTDKGLMSITDAIYNKIGGILVLTIC